MCCSFPLVDCVLTCLSFSSFVEDFNDNVYRRLMKSHQIGGFKFVVYQKIIQEGSHLTNT